MVSAIKPLPSTIGYCVLLVLETAFRIIGEWSLVSSYVHHCSLNLVITLKNGTLYCNCPPVHQLLSPVHWNQWLQYNYYFCVNSSLLSKNEGRFRSLEDNIIHVTSGLPSFRQTFVESTAKNALFATLVRIQRKRAQRKATVRKRKYIFASYIYE